MCIRDSIAHAEENPNPLTMNPCVRVSRKEAAEIARRFDRKNTRLTALAMLCYAKTFADLNGEFSISSVSLGCWLGIADSNLRGIYIKELADFCLLYTSRCV